MMTPSLTTSGPLQNPLTLAYSIGLFLLSGIGFGLLFGSDSLTTPYFWVIFLLLLPFFLLRPSSPRRGFLEGMVFGLGANLLGLRWLLVTMQDYGHLPLLLSLGGLGLFSLYLSLYPALFRMLTSVLSVWRDGNGSLSFRALLVAPTLWILTEAGRTEILTGFPWNPLGSLLFGHRDFVLAARLVGVTGLSFLIVAGSVLLALFLEELAKIPRRERILKELSLRGGILFLFFLLWILAGRFQDASAVSPSSDNLPVALIQGNIPPDEKWSADKLKKDLEIYQDLSREGVRRGARLLLWPETALPIFYNAHHPVLSQNLAAILSPRTFLVTGSIGEVPDPGQPTGTSFTNAAVLFDPKGEVRSDYVKQHLVPFGEYLPLPEIFGWLRPLIGVTGDMARGNTPGRFALSGEYALTPLICYEALYPSLVRKNLGTSQMMAVISDDAWFGRTSAPYQLFRESAMRAIENGVPMLRAANTGLSGIVLPDGRVLLKGPLFKPVLLEGDVPFFVDRTFYRAHGEWVLKGSLLCILFWRALLPLCRPRKENSVKMGSSHPLV